MPRLSSLAAMLLAAPVSLSATAPAAVPVTPAVAIVVKPAVATAIAATAARPEPALVTQGAALKAGDFVWTDAAAAPVADGGAPVQIAVSIADQRLYAFRGGTLFAVSTVSTGRPGHSTPTGAFPITEKARVHHSNKYNNAPMPFMQRLTNDGVALHAGHIPGRPASHGCVRLPLAFAEKLFGVTSRGGMVVITQEPLAALAGQAVTFDGGTVRPLPPAPAPAPAPVVPATTDIAQPSLIASAIDASLMRLRSWTGN